jgi:cell division protein FtsL
VHDYALLKNCNMDDINKTGPDVAETEGILGKKQKKTRRPIQDFLGGDYLSKEIFISSLPYILFVAILVLIYISNTYYAEKTVKEIEQTKSQLKELRFQYITTKASLMYHSKQTEIADRAKKYGLKETNTPPYKIFYKKDTINNQIK